MIYLDATRTMNSSLLNFVFGKQNVMLSNTRISIFNPRMPECFSPDFYANDKYSPQECMPYFSKVAPPTLT